MLQSMEWHSQTERMNNKQHLDTAGADTSSKLSDPYHLSKIHTKSLSEKS